MNKTTKILMVVTVLLGFGFASYTLGYYSAKSSANIIIGSDAIDAGQLLEKYFEPNGFIEHDEIFNLYGEIVKISDNQISLKQLPDEFTPLVPKNAPLLTIIINPETQIQKITPKTPEEFEMAINENPEKADSLNYLELKLSELQKDDIIHIYSEKNIKGQTKITAKQLYIFEELK